VTFGAGPLLLLAGPGAGKTRTLTHGAAYLLASGRAKPWEILAVTFSLRAAGELRLRLADLLGEEVARGVTVATFHSVRARLLREHASVFGRTERYTIYDHADMRRVVDWLISDAERGEIQRALANVSGPALLVGSASGCMLITRPPVRGRRSRRHDLAATVARRCRRLRCGLLPGRLRGSGDRRDADDVPRLPDGAMYATSEQLAARYQLSVQWVESRSAQLGATPISDSTNSKLRYHLATADACMDSRRRRPPTRVRGTGGRTPKPRKRTHSRTGWPRLNVE
jgi:hypothetical protein